MKNQLQRNFIGYETIQAGIISETPFIWNYMRFVLDGSRNDENINMAKGINHTGLRTAQAYRYLHSKRRAKFSR